MVEAEARWRPKAKREALEGRAQLLADIRHFFAQRGVLEVETPILATAAATAPHLQSLATCYQGPQAPKGQRLFLQTSPEHAMKRLLAAGSGPIYQIARVFRNGESGRRHNPEFTMLEWYRPGFDHLALMEEVDMFLGLLLGTPKGERLSYREVFQHYLEIDVFTVSTRVLKRLAEGYGFQGEETNGRRSSRQFYQDFLMAAAIEAQLGQERPCFVYDYPASEAQLARIRPASEACPVPLAERFEVYLHGMELANGYHELSDAAEQRQRFKTDLAQRKEQGLEEVPLDEFLLAALAQGLPNCAGVALGVDRLLMLLLGSSGIEEVLAFPLDRV